MRIALLVLALLVAGAVLRQHWIYLNARVNSAQDTQQTFYGRDAFHLITFLRTEEDSDAAVLEALRQLKSATEPELSWIYAGRVAANGGHSPQLGDKQWTAVALLQAPSRERAEASLSGPLDAALAAHPDVHVQGFDRPVLGNILLPQMLGARRLVALLRREPSNFPFVRRESELTMPEASRLGERMLRGESMNTKAAVVFNLSTPGTPEQQKKDAAYVGRMLGSMAEGHYGPIHRGPAIRVMGEAEFENVVIVYYPGVRFFSEMIQSDFFQGIIGDKQLGDNQSTITVPVLDRL